MADNEKQKQLTPPGDFVSDDLREQTTRFLDELRQRLKRVKLESEPRLGPPRRPR
jgi:hypothetical protein